MKSEVIEYIKNNTYIEELFLDFIDEFKEQYNLLKNKEKKELLKKIADILAEEKWITSAELLVLKEKIEPNILKKAVLKIMLYLQVLCLWIA